MSKMLMGQINHARGRVNQLKAEKTGAQPVHPKVLDGDDYKKAFRKGDVSSSPAKLKQAWECFVNRNLRPHVENDSSWNHLTRSSITTCKLGEAAVNSMEEALASFHYAAENAGEILRYSLELELYNTRKEAIELRAQVVEDAIVLGEQSEALKALNAFATFEV